MHLQQTGHPFVLVSPAASEQAQRMRLRRTTRPALELTSSDHQMAVWDGFATATGPNAIIRAARAGELIAADEVKQVA